MMALERLAAAIGAADVLNPAPVELRDLAYDTRAVGPGALFFCVRGAHADGHDLARALVDADTRVAMAPAADEFFGRPTEELEVAGVTGTNGKTTTTFLLFAILAAA